jgi:GST-like protein
LPSAFAAVWRLAAQQTSSGASIRDKAELRFHGTTSEARARMIDFYTWSTPNGRKVSILLEELGMPYETHAVDITNDEQFAPEFLAIAINNKIPAIVDRDNGLSLFESGAIMVYLAEKGGKFLPTSGEPRARVMEWLMWQMGGFGPMLGQLHHFGKFNKGVSQYAEDRFSKEARRLYGVLDKRLADNEHVAGDYSIADMAIWPWASRFEWQGIDLNDFPNVLRWYTALADRPAVEAGYHVPVKQAAGIPRP